MDQATKHYSLNVQFLFTGTMVHASIVLPYSSVLWAFVRDTETGIEACTDVECVWDKPKKTSQPMETDAIDIRIQTTPHDPALVPTPSNYTPSVDVHLGHFQNIEKDVYSLFKGTNALILQTLDSPSDSDSEDELHLPTMREAVNQVSPHMSNEQITNHLQSVFTDEAANEIDNSTRGQSSNPDWFLHRQGRITASNISSVMHFRYTDTCRPDNYILKKVMN